ncbi:MAG: TIGR02444 family protein [Betaproteobacteria bacterium]|nr:MAG: TIGR02444 family protein [Betaproteobacteria bacterium]
MNDSDFWRFSLAFYGRAGVPETCLRLQDARAVDVNVMLYLLFLAGMGIRIQRPDLDRIESLVGDWRESVVRPLRGVRRTLKTIQAPFATAATEKLRNEVKRIELEAERLQQLVMEQWAAPTPPAAPCGDLTACARHNLRLYADRLGGLPSEDVEAILRDFAQGTPPAR